MTSPEQPSTQSYQVTVWQDDTRHTLTAPHGANLRRLLLKAKLSPYTAVTRRLNCGGRGLCATCGVWLEDDAPSPTHWHDKIGNRFGYPRLSCQVQVTQPLTVRLVTDKIIWGRRK